MGFTVYFDDKPLTDVETFRNINSATLKQDISVITGISAEDIYLTQNGRPLPANYDLQTNENAVRAYTRIVGGKGGFGSMLRAIGAQIEKTTNREACRDLSGRRLRDINEEKRLRKWLDGQADREKEAVERKQKRLERLTAEPKLTTSINDPVYENERQALPERVSEAVDAGWLASTSQATNLKRKADDKTVAQKKKKLWIDAELSECSSGTDDDDEEEEVKVIRSSPTVTVTTDSGNESDRASVASSSKI